MLLCSLSHKSLCLCCLFAHKKKCKLRHTTKRITSFIKFRYFVRIRLFFLFVCCLTNSKKRLIQMHCFVTFHLINGDKIILFIVHYSLQLYVKCDSFYLRWFCWLIWSKNPIKILSYYTGNANTKRFIGRATQNSTRAKKIKIKIFHESMSSM